MTMQRWMRSYRAAGVAVATAAALLSAGCGGGEQAPAGGGSAAGDAKVCDPVPGQELVVLEDDKHLQTVDNVIPAISQKAATPPLTKTLDAVSATLTTDDLIGLNRQVVVERQTSANAAKAYVEDKGLLDKVATGGSGKVVIGAANFAENQTIASIYELVLDRAGFDASTETIGNRELYAPALMRGEVQVVPEYVGTLTKYLNKKANGANAAPRASGDVDKTVAALTELGEAQGLVFGKRSQAADQNAFAVTKGFADEHGVTTLSDLSSTCGGGVSLGGPPDCNSPERVFCRPGLEKTYGLKIDKFQALDAGGPLTKTAVKQGKVALGLVFSSDGELAAG
ncbi:MAG: glycine/betaine ABC transporter substrate-binding protein [Actinomycetota bacterium]|nr:glycine/betaine ABC transporter substrate-binding protein [Actinomycetota bacterium]